MARLCGSTHSEHTRLILQHVHYAYLIRRSVSLSWFYNHHIVWVVF